MREDMWHDKESGKVMRRRKVVRVGWMGEVVVGSVTWASVHPGSLGPRHLHLQRSLL
jgi:hypothetical protein